MAGRTGDGDERRLAHSIRGEQIPVFDGRDRREHRAHRAVASRRELDRSTQRLGINRAADSMLTRLSELLRMTVDRQPAAEIPLDEEIELAQRYLAIEKIRFEDRRYKAELSRLDTPERLARALKNNGHRDDD